MLPSSRGCPRCHTDPEADRAIGHTGLHGDAPEDCQEATDLQHGTVPSNLAQTVLIHLCSKRGLAPFDSLRKVLESLRDTDAATPTDLRRWLGSGRTGDQQLGMALQKLLPPPGRESIGGCHCWFQLGQSLRGQAWLGSSRGLVRQADGRMAEQDVLVVLKLLRPEMVGKGEERKRFDREIAITQTLEHPNLVRHLGSGVDALGAPYLILGFIDGGDLGTVVSRQGALPVKQGLIVIRQAALGLASAHAAGVVHRDVNPSNLLISRKGTVKVADFGSSHATFSAWASSDGGVDRGLPTYLAPEQLDERSPVDGRSDVYALGAVLFELIAGVPPFTGNSPSAVALGHLSKEPPQLKAVHGSVTAEVRDLVTRCLSKRVDDRPSAAELAERCAVALRSMSVGSDEGLSEPTIAISVAEVKGGSKAPATRPPTAGVPRPATGVETMVTGAAFTGVAEGFETALRDLRLVMVDADDASPEGFRCQVVARRALVIGRGGASGCDLEMHLRDPRKDGQLGRLHARFDCADQARAITVRDLGSRNGSFIDGRILDPARDWPLVESKPCTLRLGKVLPIEVLAIPQRTRRDVTMPGAPPSPGAPTGIDSDCLFDAVILHRSDQPGWAGVMCLRRFTLGVQPCDVVMPGAVGSWEFARYDSRWMMRPADQERANWQPLKSGIIIPLGPKRLRVRSE